MENESWKSVVQSRDGMKMMVEGLRRSSESSDATQSPIFKEAIRCLGEARTVLDIGAGVGRFTGPLAAAGCDVTAIEPADEMQSPLLETLTRFDVRERVRVVQSAWPTQEEFRAEVSLAAFVIQFAADPVEFVRAMERVTTRRCILAVHVDPMLAFLQDLWPLFHPGQTAPQIPIFTDIYPKLLAEGIVADVHVFSEQHGPRFNDPKMALDMLTGRLGISDDAAAIERLRVELQARFAELMQTGPRRAAVISWQPR